MRRDSPLQQSAVKHSTGQDQDLADENQDLADENQDLADENQGLRALLAELAPDVDIARRLCTHSGKRAGVCGACGK